MADTTTTNLGLTKPEVGSSADSWGDKVNANFDALDTAVDLKAPKASPEFTGTATFDDIDVTGTATMDGLAVVANTPQIDFIKASSADVLANIRAETDAGSGGKLVFQTKRNGNTALDRMAIDDDGNVGIGTSSPTELLHLSDTTPVFRMEGASRTYQQYVSGTDFIIRDVTAGLNRVTLDSSGNLLVGKTTTSSSTAGMLIGSNGRFDAVRDGGYVGYFNRLTSDGGIAIFAKDGTTVGSISVTGSTTTYNTSSDYRLKDITGSLQGSGAYIDSLNPVEGTWKADGSVFVGLIAHEADEVSRTPIATGEKDGEEMQSMSYSSSEMMANILAELQSLRKRVAELEA